MAPRLVLLLPCSLFAFLFFFPPTSAMPVKLPRQYLPPQPGYIPVYIQDGDTPPDVESIYEVLDGRGPAVSDVQEVPQRTDLDQGQEQEQELGLELEDNGMDTLRESKEVLVRQLTDSTRENEVPGVGEAEELPK
ncbi:uncharacterized protein LOC124362343 isoform X2 [Homalodisca vitripennis]|uniref:uncharacterized protein LOC124362343 isoform X2 n=1 Tax=Homalodisca vitripennis TaxID=197043 RepID=UPI001EEBC8B0|nr:uncharacterized protein LOC124362343 isoform X2 [Homalodisca vitripennis]